MILCRQVAMEAAKNTISGFLQKAGQQKTHVDELVNPHVTHEAVKPHRHEEVTQAINREIHQYHYHSTIYPVAHQETLPERHTHNMLPVEEREFHHDAPEDDKQKVAAQAAQFKNSSVKHEAQYTSSHAPAVAGEHYHHHVHEIVQPVVYKETVKPEVVHVTVPIREKILAPSEHHGWSMLPSKTMEEFTSMGGKISGGTRQFREFEGDPKPYNPKYQQVRYDVDKNWEAHDGLHDLESTGHLSTPPTSNDSASAGVTGSANRTTVSAAPTHAQSSSIVTDKAADHSSTFGNYQQQTATTNSNSNSDSNSVPNPARQQIDQVNRTTSSMGDDQKNLSPAERQGSRNIGDSEPKNLVEEGANDSQNSADDKVQNTSETGEDPALVKNKTEKLSGDGEDGSHSAVFGLTSDGHKS